MDPSLGRVLVTGASGQLGSYLLRALRERGVPATAWCQRPNVEMFGYSCHSVDLRDVDAVAAAFRAAAPNVVIHAAAMSGVGDCFREPTQAQLTNATATQWLAALADRQGARFVYVSTDLVFDGRKPWYTETDCPAPLSVYGNTKAAAERAVLAYHRHLVMRISLLFGPSINGRASFFDRTVDALRHRTPWRLFHDEWRTPLSLRVAAQALLAAAASDVHGILHLGGPERMSRLEMGQRLAHFLQQDDSCLTAVARDEVPASEPRPRDTSLGSERWCELFPNVVRPGYEASLETLFAT